MARTRARSSHWLNNRWWKFDARSSEINEELDVVVYDQNFGRDMEAVFEKDLAQSREYTLQQFKDRSLWERTTEWLMLPFRSQL